MKTFDFTLKKRMKLFDCVSDQNNNGNTLQELLIFCYSLYFFKTLEFVIFTQYTTLQINEVNRTPTLTLIITYE